MKYATIFALILACSMATSLSSTNMNAITKQFQSMWISKSSNPFEDVKYCGLYESQCLVDPAVSVKETITLNGMMHHKPVFEERAVTSFWGPACGEEEKLSTVTAVMSLEPLEGNDERFMVTIQSYTVNYASELAFKDYRCEEPLKVNTDYDITKLNCIDGAAADPFAAMKAEIGVPGVTSFEFNEDSIVIPYGRETLTLARTDDTGCHCSKLRN